MALQQRERERRICWDKLLSLTETVFTGTPQTAYANYQTGAALKPELRAFFEN